MAEIGRIGTNNMAHVFGGEEVVKSLDEILSPGKPETRSAEEIKERIKKGLSSLVDK